MRGPYRRTLQFRFRRSSFSFFWISTYGECKQYGKSAGPQPRGAPLRVDLRSQLASSGVAPGAPHAISGRPLCRPSRPFVGPIFKGSKGSRPCKNSAKFCKRSSGARLFAIFSTLNALRPRKSERNRLV
jgi:hypothetical protein